MRRIAVIFGMVLSLAAAGVRGADGADDPARDTVRAIQEWVTAVNAHAPGSADASVAKVCALTFKERSALNAGLGLFLAGLRSRTVRISGKTAAQIDVIGRSVAASPGATAFLKRAVVLHTDAVIYAERFHVALDAAARTAVGRDAKADAGPDPRAHAPTPPLLTDERLVISKDGEILGDVIANWNWPFARSLLDRLPTPDREYDPFVAAWYHATTAYMFGNRFYGEATTHLERAADILPGDARVLYDRACYAEILGLPEHQVLLPHVNVRRPTSDLSWLPAPAATALRIPRAAETNAEAERLFRRALQADPSLVEARVRLARLLELRKRDEDAAAELTTALQANPTGTVAFYAHLFAGRAAQALGRIDDAAGHFTKAAALFPDAQSALLALSQVALLHADVPAALAPVQRLGGATAALEADPWWQYALAAGRDADPLMLGIWESVPR